MSLSKPISFFVEGLSAHALGSFGIINPWEQLGQANKCWELLTLNFFFNPHCYSYPSLDETYDMIVFDFQFQSSVVAKAIN
jgi:hypothetical protein